MAVHRSGVCVVLDIAGDDSLSAIVAGRCCGMAVLPFVVTRLFKDVGVMSLPFSLLTAMVLLLAALLLCEAIVKKCGMDNELVSETERTLLLVKG